MSKKKFKAINRIKKAIAPLSPVLLKDIPRPQTVEEGRANLRRFYGCTSQGLVVLLSSYDKSDNFISLPQGIRFDGVWSPLKISDNSLLSPHSAINSCSLRQGFYRLTVNVEHMTSLSDLYRITNSGCFNGAHDPSFTINLILGQTDVIDESSEDAEDEKLRLMMECQRRLGERYFSDAWLKDPSVYRLYSNDDPTLKADGGFYLYSLENDFNWRWRQMNNLDTRYLHWLLLGPFAPYRYGDESEELAA